MVATNPMEDNKYVAVLDEKDDGPSPSAPVDEREVELMEERARMKETRPVLYGLLMLQFGVYVPVALAAPFFPEYANNLNMSNDQVGVIFGVFPLASFFAGIISMWLLPYFGRIKILVVGGFISSLGSLAFAYSNTYIFFIVSRVAGGIGTGFVNSACTALISSVFDDRDLAHVFALGEAVIGTGYALGPGVGAILFDFGGFQAPFIASAVMAAAMTLIAPPIIRRYLTKKRMQQMAIEAAAANDEEQRMGDAHGVLLYDAEGNIMEAEETDGSNAVGDGAMDAELLMTSYKALFCKIFNTGFILGSVNIFLNGCVYAVLEPVFESHFNAYMTLNVFEMGQMFFWPSIFYASWTLGFVSLCKRFQLFRGNLFSIMGVGLVVTAVGCMVLAPPPFLTVEKDSAMAWVTQVIGLLLLMLGLGMGAVPSIPAMKQSVVGGGDLFDDVIGSMECSLTAFGLTIGPIAGSHFVELFSFEVTSYWMAMGLVTASIPYFVYHFAVVVTQQRKLKEKLHLIKNGNTFGNPLFFDVKVVTSDSAALKVPLLA
jgi:MFS family permease